MEQTAWAVPAPNPIPATATPPDSSAPATTFLRVPLVRKTLPLSVLGHDVNADRLRDSCVCLATDPASKCLDQVLGAGAGHAKSQHFRVVRVGSDQAELG
jgi:hypothetical protein